MQLSVEPYIIEELKKRDPTLAWWIEQLAVPVRTMTPDLFEAMISSIISQQISTKAAVTILDRLRAKSGRIAPQAIKALGLAEIQACGMSFRKAGYILAACEAVLTGQLNLDELSSAADERVIEVLTELPGIGRWTAEMLMIFSLGRQDVLSISDLGIQRGIMRAYRLTSVTKKDLLELRQRFSPYATSAGLYFWKIAGLSPEQLDQLIAL